MSKEIYKKTYFDNYLVSNMGNVKDQYGNILHTRTNSDGYKTVKRFLVHRLVATSFIPNPDNKSFIDHINGDRGDNRVENLRWATINENNFNKSIYKNNTSGYKGISWDKYNNKWRAHIRHNDKSYTIGRFTDINEAIKARQLKANELFGDFVHSSERVVNLNIDIPKNTKLNINIKVKEDEELKQLEEEFIKLIR